MTIQVNDETALRLERAAADAGVDVSALVERLLILEQNQHDPAVVRRRGEAIDQWLEHANASTTATSGRNGRPWREFIHEGHKY